MRAAGQTWPAYLALARTGELERRAARAYGRLCCCTLCPRECKVDRLAGRLGECRTGERARVQGFGPHFGEEAPLVGRGGSGTIFFAGCNLTCVFCQNHTISHPKDDPAAGTVLPDGSLRRPLRWEVASEELAVMMLQLQAAGCENINFVSPSHVVPQILAALVLAIDSGLRLLLVYNTGGYDSVETLRLLDGVIDIYMPDMKYGDDEVGGLLSGVPDYVRRNRAAVLEMYRQVGDLQLGPGRRGLTSAGAGLHSAGPSEGGAGPGPSEGGADSSSRAVAQRGLLVRHLVLPGGLAGTSAVARFLTSEVSPDTYMNVMDQYHPAHHAARYPQISRALTAAEYRAAVEEVISAGLWRLDGLVDAETNP